MKASDLFVKALENEGVEYVFGVPGEENLDLLESLRTSKIKFILTRSEQGAGFMAATVGRLTGHAGVCLTTLGPGATNLTTAVAYAYLGGMPMVAVTAQKPIKNKQQSLFQIVDVVGVMKPITKLSRRITWPSTIASDVGQAFKIASKERPGSVHLELPQDIATSKVRSRFIGSRLPPVAEESLPSERTIKKIVKAIENAKQPLILVGAGGNRMAADRQISNLIQKTGLPFFDTPMAKGVVDENHPRFLGTAAVSRIDFVPVIAGKSDLIISIGYDEQEQFPFPKNDRTRMIQINSAFMISQITRRINRQEHWNFSPFLQAKKLLKQHTAQKEKDNRFPLIPQRVVASVRKVLPQDALVCLDTGIYKIWFGRNYKVYKRNTLLLDNALATMGAGLPSAIAAKLIFPRKKVVAVCGDGGFMMSVSELETAVRLGLNLTILVLNDSGFGMIKWEQVLKNFPSFGLDFGNPDFVKFAESFGARGYRLTSASDLSKLLSQALNSRGVNLIEVPVDYSENNKVFFKELKELTKNL